jgi:hypothetical protein
MATIEQRTTQDGKAVYRVKVRVKVPHHSQTRFTICLMLKNGHRSLKVQYLKADISKLQRRSGMPSQR